MKINKINILYLLMLTSIVFACEDDDKPYGGPYTVEIAGPGAVTPATEKTYTIGDYLNPDSYTWTIDGPAEIKGETSGESVKVQFKSIGEVTLSVTNGTDAGYLLIEVDSVAPDVAASYSITSHGVLKNGASDTVYLKFASPLVDDPEIVLNTDTSGFAENKPVFQSGSLGELQKVSDTEYYVIYTAGEGNGTPEALLTGMTTSAEFGGKSVDHAYVKLYEVDNIAPVAELSYSDQQVNDSTEVTITATFSEPVTFIDKLDQEEVDSAIFVTLSGADIESVEDDTLRATSDPLVFTYTFTLRSESDGPVTVILTNVADLGGNEVGSVTNSTALVVDNTAPVVTGSASDAGEFVDIQIAADEAGTGWYLILAGDADAPTAVNEFLNTEGVASGSVALGEYKHLALAPGAYKVYYLGQDGAENYSSITSSDLTVTE